MFSSAISPTLIGKTLEIKLCFQRNGEKTFTSVQISPNQPERKSASACGGNNNVGAHECFHKADLHIALT